MLKAFVAMCLSSLPLLCEAEIIETRQISEVIAYVDSDTWVFLDLDDTLLTSELQVGRADYFWTEVTLLKSQGYDEETAFQTARQRWNKRQGKCPVRAMDPITATILNQIQKMAAYVIGLTARSPIISSITHQQLESLGLDFSKCSPKSLSASLPYENCYEQGIWFVGPNAKGTSVRRWLGEISHHPRRIVFVDDRRYYLENMEEELSDLEIDYVGIHYTKVLEEPFDLEIAQIQAEAFPEILTNEEAMERLSKNLHGRLP